MTDKKHESGSVCIVCGAPGSGKTTYVQQNLQPGDLVVDLDAIVGALTGTHEPHPDYSYVIDIAHAVRETIYSAIEAGTTLWKRAFVITSTPNRERVDRLADRLGATCHYMETTEEECIQRIEDEPTRPNKDEDKALVHEWFKKMQEGDAV